MSVNRYQSFEVVLQTNFIWI